MLCCHVVYHGLPSVNPLWPRGLDKCSSFPSLTKNRLLESKIKKVLVEVDSISCIPLMNPGRSFGSLGRYCPVPTELTGATIAATGRK